jgi:uncharacterized protein YndB with AHSA1/START domain
MTQETTSFVYVTYIRATLERIFAAITTPDIAKRYWAHENVSDWTPGARWEHVRSGAKRTVELVGEVIEHTPPRRLVITWANASQAGDPTKCSRVTFDIVRFDGMAQLTATHDALEPGSGMAAGVSKGWPRVLSSLKSFLETGQAIDVFAKPSDAALAA